MTLCAGLPDVEVGKFDIARLEPVGPVVELKGINLGENLAQLVILLPALWG
jgi:hypothetical protein